MSRLLIHIATGPENPTRAALGLLVARTALEAGHDVDVFIAGDGVSVLRPETLDAGHGIGTGHFREHVDALVAGGATLYASGRANANEWTSDVASNAMPRTIAPRGTNAGLDLPENAIPSAATSDPTPVTAIRKP